MSEISLDKLVRECKLYNRFAQRLLYDKFAPAMIGICLRYINDREVVKDIVQECFVKVFLNIKQYNGSGSFEGWMKRIFINASITYIRQNKNKKFLKLENVSESELLDESEQENESIETENSENIEQNSYQMVKLADFSKDELMKVLEALPDKYKIVFNLFCVEEYRHEEIAELLKIEVSTSRIRLMRAREAIKKELYALSLIKLNKGR